MSFYTDMQAIATGLLAEFKQGSVAYLHRDHTGDPWDPTVGTDSSTPLDAAVKGVSQQYVDGKLVVSTDLEVTASVFGITPSTSDRVMIDGAELQIIQVIAIPAAGETIVWKLIVRA